MKRARRGKLYDAADNSARSYSEGIAAIRMEGVRAGRFLPLPGHPDEIKASPIVDDVRRIGKCTLYMGDCTAIVPLMRDLDACATDPPYELGFMGKSWDSSGVAAAWQTWAGVRMALKPGAHLVAFAGSRTYHRIAMAIDNAGFEIRDQIATFLACQPRVERFLATLAPEQARAFLALAEDAGLGGMLSWLYGSGFPKSLDVGKAVDKAALGQGRPVTAEDRTRWSGWGTALKPGHEPVCFARKPLAEGTVAANVLRWGTGALNIAGAQVGTDGGTRAVGIKKDKKDPYFSGLGTKKAEATGEGRWPANVVTDASAEILETFPPSARDALRFFYAAKADRSERELGFDAGARGNVHPTVKPIDLMRWLCRLITPPGGTVLDPFMGSGTTGVAAVREGMSFIGCEQYPDYFEIACRRIQTAVDYIAREPDLVREISKAVAAKKKAEQGELL